MVTHLQILKLCSEAIILAVCRLCLLLQRGEVGLCLSQCLLYCFQLRFHLLSCLLIF